MGDTPDPKMSVGGQAVIEGVMMRAPEAWSIAVRRPDGVIESIRHPLPKLTSRSSAARIPFVRGILVLIESVSLGYRALTWSANKSMGEDEEPLRPREIAFSLSLALVVFAALFMVAPAWAAKAVAGERGLWFAASEALIRMTLFIGYVWLLGRSKDLRRVFLYHGAEHMTIHAFERDEPLSVEAIKKYRPEHPRCGTNFLMIVIILAIIIYGIVGSGSVLMIIVSRVIGIPVIAGISYELLRLGGLHEDSRFGRFLAAPGMWLQKLTTARPEDPMIEVAVASLLAGLEPEQAREAISRGGAAESAIAAFEALQDSTVSTVEDG